MAQVSLHFRCIEWFYGLAQTRTLTQASQGGVFQPIVKFRLSHQDDIGTCRIAGISGRQLFQFNQRVESNSLRILHNDGDLCASGGALSQEPPECRKSLNGALRLATDSKAREQQFQHFIRSERHAANRGDHAARRNRLQGAVDDCRFTDADGPGNYNDSVDGCQAFLQAFHDLVLPRTNEYGRALSVCTERLCLQTKVFVVHLLFSDPTGEHPAPASGADGQFEGETAGIQGVMSQNWHRRACGSAALAPR